jgi:hypothetical protein
MGKSKGISGGGIESRKLVKPPVRLGKPAQGMHPCGTIGLAKVTTYKEPAVPSPKSVPLGNQCALKGTGVGADRTVMKAGSQSTSPGPSAPMTSSHDWPHDKAGLKGQ